MNEKAVVSNSNKEVFFTNRPPEKKSKKWLIIGLVAGLVVMVGVGLLLAFLLYKPGVKETPKTAEEIYADLSSKVLSTSSADDINAAIKDVDDRINSLKNGDDQSELWRYYSLKASAYYNSGQYTEAISDFQKALEVGPDYAPCYLHGNLQSSFRGLEDTENQIKHLKLAIESCEKVQDTMDGNVSSDIEYYKLLLAELEGSGEPKNE
jgi:tetratricopeptide (TPR) repeat protein